MYYFLIVSLLMSSAELTAAGHEHSIAFEQQAAGTCLGQVQMIERVFVVSKVAMEEMKVTNPGMNGIVLLADESDEEPAYIGYMIERENKLNLRYPYRWDKQDEPIELCCCTLQ